MPPYSLTEHIAKSIWFSRWHEGLLAVFSAYFDASGHEEESDIKFVSVAGFIAPADVWIDFETRDGEHLLHERLDYFHMSDCANYRFDFEGWQTKEQNRQKLLRDSGQTHRWPES